MMREFEVIIWATINSRDFLDLEGVLKEGGKESPQRQVLYRLLMTAFYLKEKFCRKEEFDAIKAYFILNFPQFLGKYTTEWLLLSEPDVSFINPKVLNLKFMELCDIHDQMTKIGDGDTELELDFNKLVEDLGEES